MTAHVLRMVATAPVERRLADMLRAELEQAAELRLDGRIDVFADLLTSAPTLVVEDRRSAVPSRAES